MPGTLRKTCRRVHCIQITVLVVILSIVLPNIRIVEKPAPHH